LNYWRCTFFVFLITASTVQALEFDDDEEEDNLEDEMDEEEALQVEEEAALASQISAADASAKNSFQIIAMEAIQVSDVSKFHKQMHTQRAPHLSQAATQKRHAEVATLLDAHCAARDRRVCDMQLMDLVAFMMTEAGISSAVTDVTQRMVRSCSPMSDVARSKVSVVCGCVDVLVHACGYATLNCLLLDPLVPNKSC